ncbi:DUF3782 domain-containing protein [Sulfolobus sp. E5-1-F]|uniref:PD-(D/E)XK nuclease family protein n=1 Tax=Saccharolobus sp. E5-1-F TaxID=2663019 RepID=UPI001295CDA3|nr:PD-(D/E)XK nuclease family protein [Sulfolobus sp. E5-1-F]QGA54096.1 DUF3782 domain-containing protein [Sulfolobus sp. E5-1-F]
MSLEEEIKKVLLNNPSILVDVLTAKPEIIYQVLAKITPWQSLATKEDLKSLEKDINEIKSVMATKQDVDRLDRAVEEIKSVMATKEDLKAMATKEDLKSMATKQDVDRLDRAVEEIKSVMATKEDLKAMATKEDLKRLENIVTALGARWGIMNEDAFRQGISELLSSSGWKISREVLYDKNGYVYDEPSDVEYDIVIKDGNVILVEITSSIKRGDLPVIKKKKELYEKVKNVKVNLVYVITPFVHDRYPERVKAMAKDMGIEIIYPSS